MRKYINDEILKAFPEELQTLIIETKVISGYESRESANSVTIDKLYLLSTKELYGERESNDTLDETRQLDYYKNYENTDGSIGVTTSNCSGAIKKNNGSAYFWWLRSAFSDSTVRFYIVNNKGCWVSLNATSTDGVAVAFRIG